LRGFDLDAALDRLGGNAPLLASLLHRFAAEHHAGAEEVAALVEARDPERAAAELHRLRGAARIVGAFELADAAQSAEDGLRRGDRVSLANFQRALDEACAGIATLPPGDAPR
jgi:HPt (histidine-containing phosphotransfer) domain-containing protein